MFTFFPGKLLIVITPLLFVPFVRINAQYCADSVIIEKELKEYSENHNFKIKNAEVKNDFLLIEVEVCKKNKKKCFSLVTSGFYAESLPPQLEVLLIQKKPVKCKKGKYRTQQLVFNISKLKYKGSKELVLQLRSYSGSLKYMYN